MTIPAHAKLHPPAWIAQGPDIAATPKSQAEAHDPTIRVLEAFPLLGMIVDAVASESSNLKLEVFSIYQLGIILADPDTAPIRADLHHADRLAVRIEMPAGSIPDLEDVERIILVLLDLVDLW